VPDQAAVWTELEAMLAAVDNLPAAVALPGRPLDSPSPLPRLEVFRFTNPPEPLTLAYDGPSESQYLMQVDVIYSTFESNPSGALAVAQRISNAFASRQLDSGVEIYMPPHIDGGAPDASGKEWRVPVMIFARTLSAV